MVLVGLTGGIGSGKSTVARSLERRGAVVFDADVLAREAIAPRTPGFQRVVERFGRNVVASDGSIDREALAAIVFADVGVRRDLEAIVHPEVLRMFADAAAEYRDTDRVVVLSAPLLVETGMHAAFDMVIVVTASPEAQVERLVRERGMSPEAVRSRMAAQLPLEAKAEAADILIDNEGTIGELEAQVDRVWRDLEARAGATSA
jgi:dephospho-CoA kinase